jgi:sensor histidine kinase YesM
MTAPARQRLRTYARYFAAWSLAGVFYFSQTRVQRSLQHSSVPWSEDLTTWMTGMYLCAALTPAILGLIHRFPIDRKSWHRHVPLHLLFACLFSTVELAAHSVVLSRLGLFLGNRRTAASNFGVLMAVAFESNVLTYWIILAISHAISLYRRYQEREKEALRLELSSAELKTQLVRARLGALKSQLQPHFLFNTLNAIMVLVRQQKTADAEETLARLSDLLRHVLNDAEAQEVPLRRELEYLRLYLSIEQVRFRDRLRIRISADDETLDAAVPHMGLQPLVENAVRHGIGRSSSAGLVEIAARRANGSIEIRVRDDGPGLVPTTSGTGIGLANTRARLEQLYGSAARLSLEDDPRGGALATMILPYRAIAGADEEAVSHATEHAAG